MPNKLVSELDRSLLDDDEFVKLIEREASEQLVTEDHVSQQRVWKRLQSSQSKPLRRSKVTFAWAAAAAAALLVGISSQFLLKKPLPEDQFKSGGRSTKNSPMDLQLSLENGDLRIAITLRSAATSAFALLSDAATPYVIWQGVEGAWPGSLVLPDTNLRVCLVQARTSEDLQKKLSIIAEIKQLPSDSVCKEIAK